MPDPATTSLLDRANLDRDAVRREIRGGWPAPTMASCFWSTARPKRWASTRPAEAGDLRHQPGIRPARGQGRVVGYAHSSDVSLPALIRAADAVAAVRGGYSGNFPPLRAYQCAALWRRESAGCAGVRGQGKTAGRDRRLCARQGSAGAAGFDQPWRHLAGGGNPAPRRRELSRHRPLVRVNISVVAGQGDRQESGSKGYGGREGYARFIETKAWREAADGAIREALVNLELVPPPPVKWTWCWAPAGPA